MKRGLLAFILVAVLGFGVAVAAADTTGTVSVCATAAAPTHTVQVDGTGVDTVGGDTSTNCATTTYTIPTVTDTVTTTVTAPTAPTTTTAPAPTPSTIPGVGTLQWSTSYSYQTNLDKYSVLGLSGGNETHTAQFPNALTLGYTAAAVVDDRAGYLPGVTTTQASSGDWYLHCANGDLIHDSTYTHSLLLDPAYSAYQNAWLSGVLNYIGKYGLKGVFIDVFNSDVSAHHPTCSNGSAASYPFYNAAGQVVISDPAAWQAAMLSWIKTVGAGLKSHGDYVEVNGAAGGPVTGWDDTGLKTQSWVAEYAPYVNDAAVEYWQEGNTTYLRPTGTSNWYMHWDTWEQTAEYVQSLGIDFSGIEHYPSGSCTNLQWQRYTRASFLLAWDGKPNASWQTSPGKCDDWSSVVSYNPGQPTGARTQIAPGVWERSFQHGTVVINTNTSAVTVTVGGTSVSIPATDAVLR